SAYQLKSTVRALTKAGHELGCHGLTHRREYYNAMSEEAQEDCLRRATAALSDLIGDPVKFFRAPAFKISGTTLRILEGLGYEADLSINSQRLGVFSSDTWNVSWMLAPRKPYHPDFNQPWKRSESRLWEIPLSCFLVPFTINTGLVFRV